MAASDLITRDRIFRKIVTRGGAEENDRTVMSQYAVIASWVDVQQYG